MNGLRPEPEVRKFIHDISHDLQKPLSKIITISELLVERPNGFDETSKDYLLRMHEAGKQMKQLIDELTLKATEPHDSAQ